MTVEEKQALESKINDLKTQIHALQEELLANERTLWWLKRPHIAEFENGDWYMESDDNGGNFPVWSPYGVVLSRQWLSVEGNQELIDRQLAYIAESNGDDYDYPNFQEFDEQTMRNLNYAS